MEQLSEEPHKDYRLYISAEPNPDPHVSIIPQVKAKSQMSKKHEMATTQKAIDSFIRNLFKVMKKVKYTNLLILHFVNPKLPE